MKHRRAESHFIRSNPPDFDGYVRVPYIGYEGFEVNKAGNVRSRKTLYVLTPFKPDPSREELYVSLEPMPGSGVKRKSMRVAKIVFETFSGHRLPDKCRIERHNRVVEDNRYDNLYVPGFPKPDEPRPTIAPDSVMARVMNQTDTRSTSTNGVIVRAALSKSEERAIERYNRELAKAKEMIILSDAMVSLDDLDNLDLDDLMLLDIMESITREQLATFILKILELARQERGG